MAVPYSGLQEVEPELQAPDDAQHIQASPAAFGAPVAQGLEEAGQGVLKLSDFYGQVAADNAVNDYIQKSTSILRGDPSQPAQVDENGQPTTGPNGSPTHPGGYFSLRGADAMSAFHDTSASLDEALQDTRGTLQTPLAKQAFDREARRYRAQYANEMGEHYDQQFQTWTQNTNDTRIALTQNSIAANMNNPVALAQNQDDLRQAYAKKAQAQFGTDATVTQGAILKADQDFYLTQIRAAGDNGERAKQALDASGTTLASLPQYDGLVRQTNALVFNQQKAPFVQSHIAADVADAQRQVQDGARAAITATPAPSGPIYDQIAKTAGAHGASASDISFLQREAQLESSGNLNAPPNGKSVGLFQFHPDTFTGVGGTNIHDTDQQIAAALKLKQQNAQALTGADLPATDANLYLLHQQGAAGGRALLTAAPQASAVDALTPTYQTHGRTLDQAQALATQAVTGNGGTADMTAGQFVQHWAQKWGAPQTGASAYPSVADALNANLITKVDSFRTQAEQKWGAEHPDWVENATNDYERQLNRQVDQQKRSQEVNAHVVQAAMAGDNAPTSEVELRSVSPQVAQAWDELQFTNPYVRQGIEHRFDVNSKGKALVFGNNFKDYFDRAMAPDGDPNQIKDPTGLNQYTGIGEDAPLTNTGASQLTQFMAQRGTPQGEAFAAQARTFVDQVHAELTFSNPSIGNVDPQGEKLFSKAMSFIAPKMLQAYQNGTLDKALNPNDPDYLGKAVTSIARNPSQMLADRLKDHAFALPAGVTSSMFTEMNSTPAAQGQALIEEAVRLGRLSPAQAVRLSREHGFSAPRSSAPPKPAAGVAPPKPSFPAPSVTPQTPNFAGG